MKVEPFVHVKSIQMFEVFLEKSWAESAIQEKYLSQSGYQKFCELIHGFRHFKFASSVFFFFSRLIVYSFHHCKFSTQISIHVTFCLF